MKRRILDQGERTTGRAGLRKKVGETKVRYRTYAERKKREKIRMGFFLILTGLFLLFALFGRYFAPHDPYETNLSAALMAPCKSYPFGTDHLGRCILSRVLEGASASTFSALAIAGITAVFGTCIGMLAGYFGGAVDRILMKITAVFQAFPGFVLAVAVAGTLGPGLKNAMLSLGLIYWTSYARLARSLVLRVRGETYILAARLCGASPLQIMTRHVIPHIVSPILITATLEIGNVVLSMAGLSFLGLGVQAPLAEWGQMINTGRTYLQTAPWCILFPSLALFAAVLLFNLTGDCIRDVFDVGGESHVAD